MDNNKDYSCIEQNEKVLSKNIEVEEDFSQSLPAYCDDIYRVVKCISHCYINSVNITPSEITIYGKCDIMLTYYNESSSLCYTDFEEDFTKTVSVTNLSENAFALCDICDKYTNFRVINQRRIDIHSSALITLNVYDSKKYPCLSFCEGAKLKRESIESAQIITSNISKLEFDEEFSVPSDSKPIRRIISASCRPVLLETKIIKDKVLVKAEVHSDICYSAGNEEEEILTVSNTFNLSKIIEQNGIDEDDIMICNLMMGNIFNKAKSSSGDEMGIIEIFGDIVVSSVFVRPVANEYITDGYIPENKADCTYSTYNTISNTKHINESRIFNLSLEFSNSIKAVKELTVNLSPFSVKNNKLTSKAEATLIYENESGSLASMTASANIDIDCQGRENAFAVMDVVSYDYSIASDNKIELRLNTNFNAFLYDNVSLKILSDIEQSDEEIKSSPITVYFAKENESVWDIAKSFSSDTQLIINENALNSEIIDADKILIIPKA